MSQEIPRVRSGILLAGGYGSRLKPLTDSIPKCLVPFRGKPLLYYWLKLLLDNNSPTSLNQLVVNTHYLPKQVEMFVRESPWADRVTLVFERSLLGTAGTLRQNRSFFGGDPFFLAHADNLSLFSLEEIKETFDNRPDGCIGTMMTFITDQPNQCGIVEIDSEGTLVGYHEKSPNPPGNLANAAVFIFDPCIHEILKSNEGDIDLCRDTIPKLTGRLNTYQNTVYHRDIGTPISYEAATAAVASGYIRLD